MPHAQELSRRSKVLFNKEVTVVTSINGHKPATVIPDFDNKFDTYEEAYKMVQRLTKSLQPSVRTRRMKLAEAMILLGQPT